MMQEPEVVGGSVECHECGKSFDGIGYHWSRGSCSYPGVSDYRQSIITGMILAGASLRTQTSNPFVELYSAEKSLLGWIDNECEWLTTGVSLYREAAKSASLSDERGIDADESDYSDVYAIRTRSLPSLNTYTSWYSNGVLDVPDIVVSSTALRIWYGFGGSMNWDERYPMSSPYASLSAYGDRESSRGVIDRCVDSVSPVVRNGSIRFNVDDTESFLGWIGESLPGVEYKWCTSSMDEYHDLKGN